MTTQHTPGPWCINKTNNGLRIVYSDGTLRSHIADLFDMALCEEHGGIKANARLIAAAPDLLAALREMEEWVAQINDEESRVPVMIRLKAQSAIAKAEGLA